MREEHSRQREEPVQSTEVGKGQLCLGNSGEASVAQGKRKRWDPKDNGVNCQEIARKGVD